MTNVDQATGEIVPERTADQILQEWEVAATQLAILKADELRLRNEYVKLVSNPTKESGTENIELGAGYKAKIVKKQNYNVNQDTVNVALDKMENDSPEGKVYADQVIKWKAELSKTQYDLMPEKYRKMIDACITITPGTPSLEIVAPATKAKR